MQASGFRVAGAHLTVGRFRDRGVDRCAAEAPAPIAGDRHQQRLVATVLLGWQAGKLQLNASFEKTIPTAHPYIANYLQNEKELSGLGNATVDLAQSLLGSFAGRLFGDAMKGATIDFDAVSLESNSAFATGVSRSEAGGKVTQR